MFFPLALKLELGTSEDIARNQITLVVQVKGKLRGQITVAADAGREGDRTGGARQRKRPKVHGGKAAEEGDRGAEETGECGGVKVPTLVSRESA